MTLAADIDRSMSVALAPAAANQLKRDAVLAIDRQNKRTDGHPTVT